MAIKRVRTRRRASITSLIDVIFLLLLFFMLSSTFSRFSEVEMVSAAAESGGARQDHQTERIVIRAEGVVVESTTYPDSALPGLFANRRAEERRVLIVEPGEDATTQRLIDVLAILTGLPGLDIALEEPAA